MIREKFESRIQKIAKQNKFLQGEVFSLQPKGTHFVVYSSNRYVIRFRKDSPGILRREVSLLKTLKHSLIPRVIKSGTSGGIHYMVEEKIPGVCLDAYWACANRQQKRSIIEGVIVFLKFLSKRENEKVYVVASGKKYDNFAEYINLSIKQKINYILRKNSYAKNLVKELQAAFHPKDVESLFSNKKTVLCHGDLLMHNLLVQGSNLTGVIDWEMALFGDRDYDALRLCYYEECAKEYLGEDGGLSIESDFIEVLLREVFKSGLITDVVLFEKKYQQIRPLFFLNALCWAVDSRNPRENIDEVCNLWNKKWEG